MSKVQVLDAGNGLMVKVVNFSYVREIAKNGTFVRQRNQQNRLARAKHVCGELFGDKRVFSAFRVAGSDTEKLLDGYTRAEAAELGRATASCNVVLLVHEVASEQDATKIYRQLNSREAAKKARDDMESGLRDVGLMGTLTSKLCVSGPMPTALVHSTGMTGDVMGATIARKEQIVWLDSLYLGARSLSSGAVAALLAMGERESGPALLLAEKFARNLVFPNFKMRSPADEHIADLRQMYAIRRAAGTLSGTKNVNAVLLDTLKGFVRYMNATGGYAKRAVPRSLGGYLRTVDE